MRRRVESIRIQRARRRRRRMFAKLVAILLLCFLGIAVGGKAIARFAMEGGEIITVGTAAAGTTEPYVSIPEPDWQPPTIEGVEELTISAGGTISYKRNITVTDNREGEISLTVDTSQVDLYNEGDYTITYIAEDAAGNVTEVPTVLHVTKADWESATEELVNFWADELLSKILTEEMTDYEKARTIYYWVRSNVAWTEHSPKGEWYQGAYQGFTEKKGDCFVFAMTSKCLLTRAGIKNMIIEKIPTATEHYWNLIDVGDGWHHFDAIPRKDGRIFFYTSDEELRKFSQNSARNSYNYDPSEYPEIQ